MSDIVAVTNRQSLQNSRCNIDNISKEVWTIYLQKLSHLLQQQQK